MMKIARRAEARTMRRWRALKRTKYGSPERAEAERLHEQADRLMRRLWEIEGPDPLMQMVAAESARQARRASDPNPDDPDDEGPDDDG
jgi:hypothetical protein